MTRVYKPLFFTCLVFLLGGFGLVFLDGPPPGFTGGFSESTCQQCHFGNQLNDPSGELQLLGLEGALLSESRLSLRVRLTSPEMISGGFQISVRTQSGQQFGTWLSDDIRTQIVTDTTGVQYVQHTEFGTTRTNKDSLGIVWDLTLEIPEERPDTFIVNVAGNAANGDNSALGDYIYTKEIKVADWQ